MKDNHSLGVPFGVPSALAPLWTELAKYQALPLDTSVATRVVSPRPSLTEGRNVFTYSGEPINGIPFGAAPNLLNTSFTMTAEVTVPEGGGEGMINTSGGWRLRFLHREG